jgi:hypothetical protein
MLYSGSNLRAGMCPYLPQFPTPTSPTPIVFFFDTERLDS